MIRLTSSSRHSAAVPVGEALAFSAAALQARAPDFQIFMPVCKRREPAWVKVKAVSLPLEGGAASTTSELIIGVR